MNDRETEKEEFLFREKLEEIASSKRLLSQHLVIVVFLCVFGTANIVIMVLITFIWVALIFMSGKKVKIGDKVDFLDKGEGTPWYKIIFIYFLYSGAGFFPLPLSLGLAIIVTIYLCIHIKKTRNNL